MTPMYLDMVRNQQNNPQQVEQGQQQSSSSQSINILDADYLASFSTDTFRLRAVRTFTLIFSVISLIAAVAILVTAIAGSHLTPFIVVECLYLIGQGLLGVFASLSRSVKTILSFIFLCAVNALLVAVVITVGSKPNPTLPIIITSTTTTTTPTTITTTTGPEFTQPPATTTTTIGTTATTQTATMTTTTTVEPETQTPTTSMATTDPTQESTSSVDTTIAPTTGGPWWPIEIPKMPWDKRTMPMTVQLEDDEQRDIDDSRWLIETILWITVGIDLVSGTLGCFLILLLRDKIKVSREQATTSGPKLSPTSSAQRDPLLASNNQNRNTNTTSIGRRKSPQQRQQSPPSARKQITSTASTSGSSVGLRKKAKQKSDTSVSKTRRTLFGLTASATDQVHTKSDIHSSPDMKSPVDSTQSNPLSPPKARHKKQTALISTIYAVQPIQRIAYGAKKASMRTGKAVKKSRTSTESIPNALTRAGSGHAGKL